MSSVDSRIVTMKFDNGQFQEGVTSTMSALEKLKASLNFSGTTGNMSGVQSGLAGISSAARGVDLTNVSDQAHGISKAFVAMSTVAITAISRVTSSAMDMAGGMAKSLTGVEAMANGWSDYELKMQATQTIMAGTGENIDVVTKHLKSLDTYADQTIYSLSDMTSNIGKFTNAGVKLPVAVNAMKGIANVAALSGASAGEAARAMYNLGQAIGQGTVRLMDWRSVELANMGTLEFKEQLIKSALAMGTLTKSADGTITTLKGTEVTAKNFTSTLQDQWLTAEALTETLGRYSDKTTKIGSKAWKAATQVKTFSMMMETLKAAAGTGWTDTFDILVGNLPEATKLWTGITEVIGGAIQRSADARNKMLGDWKKLGGRNDLLASFKNVFEALKSIVMPIKEAFRDIFPPMTGRQLAEITANIREFTEKLILSDGASENLKTTFKGLFSIFKIITTVISGLIKFVFGLFGAFDGGGGSILTTTARIGELITKFQEWLTQGGQITKFFDRLRGIAVTILEPIVNTVTRLSDAFMALATGDISGFKAQLGGTFAAVIAGIQGVLKGISDFLGRFQILSSVKATIDSWIESLRQFGQELSAKFNIDMPGLDKAKEKLGGLKDVGSDFQGMWEKVAAVLKSVGGMLTGVGGFLSHVGEDIMNLFDVLVHSLTAYLKDLDFMDFVALLNTGVFIAMYAAGRQFMKRLSGLTKDFSGVLKELGGSLKALKQNVKAAAIMKIAVAIALLAGSLWLLSKIDPLELAAGLTAITILLKLMTMTLEKISDIAPSSKLNILAMAASLILLSISVGILAYAVSKLAELSWNELAKGLIGVGTLLAALTLFSKFAETDKGAISSGIGLLLLAGAVALLAISVEKIGNMDLKVLLKGVGTIAVLIGLLSHMAKVLNNTKGIFAASVGLLILSASLMALYFAIKLYDRMDPSTFAKGILLIAVALTAIGVAMRTMPKNMPSIAAGLLILSLALIGITYSLEKMGGMSTEEIVKSLIVLAVSLDVIASAVAQMVKALPGAYALLVVSAALVVLTGVLKALGEMSVTEIAIALGAIAGALLILHIAGALMAPIAPVLIVIGQAIMLMGLGAMLAGAGLFLFAAGLTALAAAGAAGTAILVSTIMAVANLIPLIAHQIGLGIIAFAVVISKAGPQLIAALTTLLNSFFQAIIKSAPRAGQAFWVLIRTGLQVLNKAVPALIQTGFIILMAFLRGIEANIGQIVTTCGNIIVKFLNALAQQMPRIVDAGFNLLIKFLEGIAQAIRNRGPQMAQAGWDVADAIIDGVVSGLGALGHMIIDKLVGIAGDAWGAVKDKLGIGSPSKRFIWIGEMIGEGLAAGVNKTAHLGPNEAQNMAQRTMSAMTDALSGMSDLVDADMNITPVIAPVLDLTDFQKNAYKVSNLLGTTPMSADISYRQAQVISTERNAAQDAQFEALVRQMEPVIQFEQNNYSPKALSSIEIYRQTRSQISLAKEALKI